MIRFLIPLVLGFVAALLGGPAWADPCKAIPDRGPPPVWARPGHVVTGLVRYVGDGDSLCVGRSPDPATWVEIRLADFYAPELASAQGRAARDALTRIALNRPVTCTAGGGRRVVSYDRLIAVCRLDGVSLGERLRRAGIVEGGRGR